MLSSFAPYLSNPRQSLAQVLNFALVLSTAFMLWKSLSVIADSPSPIVVVLSGSMEPAFQRGDLLFLWNRDRAAEVGEIVVYNVKGKDIPIVHRVVRSHAPAVALDADADIRYVENESTALMLIVDGMVLLLASFAGRVAERPKLMPPILLASLFEANTPASYTVLPNS